MSRYFLKSASIEGFRGINNDGDPLVLRFRPDCVNSIHAPNGVGKSSIYEALHFAIHGTVPRLEALQGQEQGQSYIVNKFHPAQHATVALVFESDDGTADVSITVTRPTAGDRTVTSPSGHLDPDAFLAALREDFVLVDYPRFASFVEMMLRECGLEEGELDCLIGGPPCQSFSYNNHQRSEKDARARLFEHYLRIVLGLKPKTIVMENVPGILTIGDGSVIEAIKAELKALGYESDVKILSAEEFGTPQVRRRVFIVASRIGAPTQLIPLPTHRSADPRKAGKQRKGLKHLVTVHKAIGDLPSIANGGGERAVKRSGQAAFSEFQRTARKGTRRIFNHISHQLTAVNLNRIIHVPEGGNWRNIPRDLLPAGMQRARLSDHTKRYGRLSRNGLASTLLTKCDPHWGAYVHPMEDRTISVREAARLQGFPDIFQFAGDSLSKHYEQVGNAVPVPVAFAIGTAAAKHLAACASSASSQLEANEPADEEDAKLAA